MTRYLLFFFFGTLGGEVFAEAFVAPQAYPIDRYEAGWQKNPFTLKTAPVLMQHDSFAKDLVLGSVSQIGNSYSVVVVNAKTRQRTRLGDDKPSDSGWRVDTVHMGEKRADIYVKLAMGGETAEVRYDDAFLKQMASAGDKGTMKTGAANGAINGNVMPPPVSNAGNTAPPGMPINGQIAHPQQGAGAPPAGTINTSLQLNNPNTAGGYIPSQGRRRQNTLPTEQPASR